MESFSPVGGPVHGKDIPEKVGHDEIGQVQRVHRPDTRRAEIVAGPASGTGDQLQRRQDLHRRQGKPEHRPHYPYPHYLGYRLPPHLGLYHTPKPQTSDQPHAALKCQRLERASLEAQNRAKAQATLPRDPVQGPHEGPSKPRNQSHCGHDVVKIQK